MYILQFCDTRIMGPLVATLVMVNIHNIPTIPDIPIIIQISWSLRFQKGMAHDICHGIINISVIPDIPTIPKSPNTI